MRALFATDRLHIPDDFSGSVQSTHALIRGLQARGHECRVVATLRDGWRNQLATVLYRLSGRRLLPEWTDRLPGYEVRRGSEWRVVPRLQRAIAEFSPDVLVLDSVRMLRVLEDAGFRPSCPLVAVMHDTHFTRESKALPFKDRTCLVTNSPFTASVVKQHFGVDAPIVPPVVHLNDYVVDRPDPQFLTLVSPHPRKGLELVLGIASKLPQIPVQLVEGWPMGPEERKELLRRIAEMPNVRLKNSTPDMREVYRDTWLLLVPSELETFGRVVVEAQASGIPAFVNDVGALPWVLGEGGMVFSPSPHPEPWVQQIERLKRDASLYTELSRKARANTQRGDFQPTAVVDRFEAVLLGLQ